MEDTSRLRIVCPYCDDHPILKGKCLYCKGTGKIVVGKSAQKRNMGKRTIRSTRISHSEQ